MKLLQNEKAMNEQTLKLLEDPEGFIRGVIEEAVKPLAAQGVSDLLDDATRTALREQALIANKTYLTRREAAKYLSVSERSIAEWAARPHDQNPFPERRAGGEPRTRRSDIDEWADRESQRQRLKLAG